MSSMGFLRARVKETSATTGTGPFSLGGAVAGFRTFLAAFGNGQLCHYVIVHGNVWETGMGVVQSGAPNILQRVLVYESTNSHALVNFGAGEKEVFCDALPESFQAAEWIDVTDYGAKGDDLNDDTAAIQAAFDVAVSRVCATVVFPVGIYRHTALVLAPVSGQLHLNLMGLGGAGGLGVRLKYTGTGGTALTIKNNTRYTVSSLRIEDAGTGAIGLALTSLAAGSNHGPGVYQNVTVTGFDINVKVGDANDYAASELTFINLEVSNGQIGLLAQGSSTAFNSTGLHCVNLLTSFNSMAAVKLTGPTDGAHTGIDVYGGSFSENAMDFYFETPTETNLQNLQLEHNSAGPGFFLRAGSANLHGSIVPSFITCIRCRPSYANGASGNHHAELYQLGVYEFIQCDFEGILPGHTIHLGGIGGATPYKSALTISGGSIYNAFQSTFVSYAASANTVWNVRNHATSMYHAHAVNYYDDRHFLVDTNGNEITITKFPFAQTGANLLGVAVPQIRVETTTLPTPGSTVDGGLIIDNIAGAVPSLVFYAEGARYRVVSEPLSIPLGPGPVATLGTIGGDGPDSSPQYAWGLVRADRGIFWTPIWRRATASDLRTLVLVALGGGAQATLGTVGGWGPTDSSQYGWLQFFDADGTPCWLPIWSGPTTCSVPFSVDMEAPMGAGAVATLATVGGDGPASSGQDTWLQKINADSSASLFAVWR